MTAPTVADTEWQTWLARFPDIFPDAYDEPSSFKRRIDRASLVALSPIESLTAGERRAVRDWLAEINTVILRPAKARVWARSAAAFAIGAAGLCATLAAAPIAVPAALAGVLIGGWGFVDIAVEDAAKDSADVVSRRLIAIMRVL